MNYDKPLVAILLGVISAIPYEVVSIIAKNLGFARYTLYQLDSLVITGNRPTVLVGFIVSSIVAGFVALVFYYSLGKLGTDYLLIKSIFISVFAWSLLEVVITFFLEDVKISPRPITGYYTHMIGCVLFGITMGILFKRFLLTRVSNAR